MVSWIPQHQQQFQLLNSLTPFFKPSIIPQNTPIIIITNLNDLFHLHASSICPQIQSNGKLPKIHCNIFFISNLFSQLPFAFSLFANFRNSLLFFSLNEFCLHSLRSIYCPSFVVNFYKWSQMIHEWSANIKFHTFFYDKLTQKLLSFFYQKISQKKFQVSLSDREKNYCHGKSPDIFFRYFFKKHPQKSRFDSVLELEQRTIEAFLSFFVTLTGDRWFFSPQSYVLGSGRGIVIATFLSAEKKTLWQAWEKGNMRSWDRTIS